jgi:ribonuclease E
VSRLVDSACKLYTECHSVGQTTFHVDATRVGPAALGRLQRFNDPVADERSLKHSQVKTDMTDSSKSDHWGSLASNLGAAPENDPAPQDQPTSSVEEAAAEPATPPENETPAPGTSAPPVAEPKTAAPEIAVGFDLPPAVDIVAESAEVEPPPLPDFIESVRREAERSEAIESTEWPLKIPDENATPVHDAGASIRTSPEPPLDLVSDSDTDAADTEATTGEGESTGDATEEKTGRRRRRRRGRRGGRKRGEDQSKSDQGESPSDSPASVSTAPVAETDAPEAATASDDADAEDAEDAGETSSDRPKHRNIPTWPEAISMIVDSNLEARSTSPSADHGRGRGRGRGGRRRGRSSSSK